MSDDKNIEVTTVDIQEWVEKAKSDPLKYMERQVTEIFLATLGMAPPYCGKFFLKGGLLMGIVYGSPRQTADMDFSTILDPTPELAGKLEKSLNQAFPGVAADLGYLDIVCKIQTIKLKPRKTNFPNAKAPGFDITVGYARRGEEQAKRLQENKAANVLHADISFKEPVGCIQIIKLAGSKSEFQAYSLKDIIAEKFRALLQQESRNRYRRQDVYDLAMLLERFSFDGDEKAQLLALMRKKCSARSIVPDESSLEADEVIRRARSEWETLEIEIGEVPDFDACFAKANGFYKSLPWGDT